MGGAAAFGEVRRGRRGRSELALGVEVGKGAPRFVLHEASSAAGVGRLQRGEYERSDKPTLLARGLC